MTAVLPPTSAVLLSYRRSAYEAGGVVARVGRRTAVPARWTGAELVMLSACNPGGRPRPPGWNRRRMAALRQALRRTAFTEGEGRWRRWSEPLLMAALPAARGLVLARRFRQNAVVVVRSGRPARLVLLPTDVGPHQGGACAASRSERIAISARRSRLMPPRTCPSSQSIQPSACRSRTSRGSAR